MKKRSKWKKLLAIGALGGSFLFQAPTCNDQAAFVTAISSTVTAGGVLWIIDRVLND